MQSQSISDKIERICMLRFNLRRVKPAAGRTRADLCLYPGRRAQGPVLKMARFNSADALPISFQLEITRPPGGPARVRVRAQCPWPASKYRISVVLILWRKKNTTHYKWMYWVVLKKKTGNIGITGQKRRRKRQGTQKCLPHKTSHGTRDSLAWEQLVFLANVNVLGSIRRNL